MTYVITEACIDVLDASCVEVCPVECIHHDEEDRICFIDPGSCTDCDVCAYVVVSPACEVPCASLAILCICSHRGLMLFS